jgi:hypothetical protein
VVSDSLPPVAIRVARPYATEDELLENELETFTRTSITLLGAQPRPQGLVLRFELVLAPGLVVMRGEGRVVGYKSNVYYGLGGLTLRFTRLDSRSKALVDKAAALRERRRPSGGPSAMHSMVPSAVDLPEIDPGPLLEEPRPRAEPQPVVTVQRAVSPPESPTVAVALPASLQSPERDALLARLRARSKRL